MKYAAIATLGLLGLNQFVYAGELTLAYTQNDMKFDSLNVSPKGYAVGYKWKYESFTPYIEYQSTTDSEINLDYSAINLGAEMIMFSQNHFNAGFIIEGGYGSISPAQSKNNYDLFSFGGGGFANYSINESLSLFINSQYIYYSEITPNTECKDGSSSESSGGGTCSHHGGIAYYNDKIGNANGLKINIGISFSF